MDSIKKFRNYPNKKEILKLSTDLLKKLIKSLKPKKIKLKGDIGLQDPIQTAILIGIANIFNNQNLKITGNFSENVVKLDVYAKGKFAVYKILFPSIGFLLKKPIRKLIKDIRKGNKHE